MDDGYRSNYVLAFPVLQRLGARASIFVTTSFVDEGMPLWPDRLGWAVEKLPQATGEIEVAGERVPLDLRTDASRLTALRDLTRHFKQLPQASIETVLEELEHRAGSALRAANAPPWCEPLRWDEIRTMQASGLVEIGNHTWRHRILSRCTPQEEREEIERAHRSIESNLGSGTDLFCYPNGTPGDYDEDTKSQLRALGYLCSPTTSMGINTPQTDLFELRRAAVNDRATFDDFLTILYGGWRRFIADLTHPRAAGGG
jgi:peptidoglycan/xylan/chitin deacetylase (PgdA/CDA1 family)